MQIVVGRRDRLGWIPKEGFATFHAFLESLGTDDANIRVSTGQDYRMVIFQVKLFVANDAMQSDFGRCARHGCRNVFLLRATLGDEASFSLSFLLFQEQLRMRRGLQNPDT